MMRYRLLGRSGMRVSELCLGTMTFGEDWGWGASKDESRRMFDAFLDAGGNFIDTACNYTNGTSERFVGEFAKGRRERLVIATKYSLSTRKDDPNGGGNSRRNLVQSLEESLARLGTDRVDLLWLHMWDYVTPLDEIMRALDDVVRAGKVHYVGVSDTPAWIVSRANTMAELRGWSRFVALQIPYNLVRRAPERELLPMAESLDLAVTPWAPLASGLLSGKYNDAAKAPKEGARLAARERGTGILSDDMLRAAGEVAKIADELGRTPAQVAINWIRAKEGPVMIPILGATKASQLADNLACLDFELSEAHVKRLDEASPIDLGFPHDFLETDHVLGLIHGETYARLAPHRRRG